ncbi:regulatory protein [Luminiphilus syltensis NOR5-1B]|uniref:Regulatory protein n=2 Tax=Luminiphilus TaxID=1341118 RepID=B8KVV8_9GAMM|nr:regulatory protein [Luminiphilus syltensis NOR5-1B]
MAMLPPILWGSTYLVTTELLPPDKPITAAVLRVLPVGLLILLMTRFRPTADQFKKLVVISLLVISLFHWPLFVAAYRLPGGLAAMLISSQPLIVALLGFAFFGIRVQRNVTAGIALGLSGVVMVLIVPSKLAWDTVGVIAAFSAALSMSLGTLLTKRWALDMPVLAFTGWQLLLGGLFLLPLALLFELPMQSLEVRHISGYLYLAFVGTLLPYFLWMSAIRHLEPVIISTLILLSPVSAMALGYVVLNQALTPWQLLGAGTVLIGILITSVPPSKYIFWRSGINEGGGPTTAAAIKQTNERGSKL